MISIRNALALLALSTAYAGCYELAVRVRRRPAALSAAIAAALLVCLEALLVHALSPFHLVTAGGLLSGNLAMGLAGIALARLWRRRRIRLPRFRPSADSTLSTWLAAFGLLTLVAALAYRPNTWDSMTYHLARVAHWIQNGSVAAYPTSNPRQIASAPGAEYLLLALQGISRSDALANLVQWAAWVLLVVAAPALARTFGVPRKLAPWGSLLVGAAPMALMQASSTQNDLVAAAMTVAVVAACAPFLHARRRAWRSGDVAVLACALVASAFVKATSLVAAAPVVLWALAASVRSLRAEGALRDLARAAPVLLVAAGVLSPFLAAVRTRPDARPLYAPYVYQGGEIADRLANSVRGVLRNVPVPLRALDAVAQGEGSLGCDRPGSRCLDYNLMLNEDVAGSVAVALVSMCALGLALVRWRSLSTRSRVAALALVASWVLFHALFRDNVWLPRLHLPLVALAPMALGAVPARRLAERGPALAMWMAAVAIVAHGALAVALNERRPLAPGSVLRGRTAEAYYAFGPAGAAKDHAAALRALSESGCTRLGLYIGGDSYDYPLTWRAAQAGCEVRHLAGPEGWPCAVFSDRGEPPPGLSSRWQRVEDTHLWVPARAVTLDSRP